MKNVKTLYNGIYLKIDFFKNKVAQVLLLFLAVRYLNMWKTLIINYNVTDNCSWESSQNIGKTEFALFFYDLLLPSTNSICNVNLSMTWNATKHSLQIQSYLTTDDTTKMESYCTVFLTNIYMQEFLVKYLETEFKNT